MEPTELFPEVNTSFTLNEEWIQQNVPPKGGSIVAATEVLHKGDTRSGVWRDVTVRLSTPKKIPYESLDQLRTYPRYFARRFRLWHIFKFDPEYKNHLMALTVRECRELDLKHKQ